MRHSEAYGSSVLSQRHDGPVLALSCQVGSFHDGLMVGESEWLEFLRLISQAHSRLYKFSATMRSVFSTMFNQ